jgi:undecaprenyl-diphosphatase
MVRTTAGVVGAFVVSLGVAVGLGLVLQPALIDNGPTSFDAHITKWFVDHRSESLTSVMRAVTWLGSSWVIVPLTVITITILVVRHRVRVAVYLGVAVAGGSLLSTLAKHIIGRERPPEPLRLAHTVSSSFPSGHATQAAATYLALAVVFSLFVLQRSTRVLTWAAVIVVIALVGVSRVYLGVHWATDVLAGWILGSLWVAGLTLAFQPLQQRSSQTVDGEPTHKGRPR